MFIPSSAGPRSLHWETVLRKDLPSRVVSATLPQLTVASETHEGPQALLWVNELMWLTRHPTSRLAAVYLDAPQLETPRDAPQLDHPKQSLRPPVRHKPDQQTPARSTQLAVTKRLRSQANTAAPITRLTQTALSLLLLLHNALCR